MLFNLYVWRHVQTSIWFGINGREDRTTVVEHLYVWTLTHVQYHNLLEHSSSESILIYVGY